MIELLQKAVIERYKQVQPVAAHDIKHVFRVTGLARKIAAGEGYALDEAEATGLLHDVGRLVQSKEEGHAEAGLSLAQELLEDYTKFSSDAQERILSAINQHSQLQSAGLLAHILQDADKLDGLGNIGLVRAYMSKSHLIDYPDGVIVEKGSRSAQTVSEQVAFQLEWFDMLYTQTARKIGQVRFDRMKQFMAELKLEIDESA